MEQGGGKPGPCRSSSASGHILSKFSPPDRVARSYSAFQDHATTHTHITSPESIAYDKVLVSILIRNSVRRKGFPLEIGVTHSGVDEFFREGVDFFFDELVPLLALGLPPPLRGALVDDETDGGWVGDTARVLIGLGSGGADSSGSGWLVVPSSICTTI